LYQIHEGSKTGYQDPQVIERTALGMSSKKVPFGSLGECLAYVIVSMGTFHATLYLCGCIGPELGDKTPS